MPCSISVDDVRGRIDPAGRVSAIEVAGTAEGCLRVELRLRCTDPSVGGDVEVSYLIDVTAGEPGWEAVVDPPSCAACGRLLTLEAYCVIEGDVRHPDCEPFVLAEPLACGDCPRIRVGRSVAEGCSAERRAVTYTVNVDAPAGAVVRTQIDYGDGTSSGATAERFYTRTRMYDPAAGVVHPRVRVIAPDGCHDAELPVLALEPCPEEEPPPRGPRCPAVTGVVAGPVSAARDGCRLVWSASMSRTPAPGTYTWRFDGGSETITTREPFITRTYGDSGRHWVEVTYRPDDPECPVSRWTGATELEGCQGRSGETDGCIAARDASIIAIATGTALLLLSLCLPDPNLANAARILGGVFILAGLIAFVLWLVLCAEKPCKPALLLGGLTLLGAGFALLHISGCCPTLGALSPLAIATGTAMLLAWRAGCDITWCAFFKEIALFNAGVLALIVATLAIAFPGCIPVFAEHALQATLLIAFDLAFAGVAWRALTCDGRIGDIEHRGAPGIRDAEPPPIDE